MSTAKKQQGKITVTRKNLVSRPLTPLKKELTLPPFSDEDFTPSLQRYIEITETLFEETLHAKLVFLDVIGLRRDALYKEAPDGTFNARLYYSQLSEEILVYIPKIKRLYCIEDASFMQAAKLIAALRAEQDLLIISDQPK